MKVINNYYYNHFPPSWIIWKPEVGGGVSLTRATTLKIVSISICYQERALPPLYLKLPSYYLHITQSCSEKYKNTRR